MSVHVIVFFPNSVVHIHNNTCTQVMMVTYILVDRKVL